jgi:photosystem II stability/assembly factor-like uncharacterized protein
MGLILNSKMRWHWRLRWLVIALLVLPAADGGFAEAPGKAAAPAVWVMQDSRITAELRGISSVDGRVAWASGTGGTVLQTVDGGVHWKTCAIPDGAADGATLDIRGVQAWDAKEALVMASGPGEKSRLFRTFDGCRSWIPELKEEFPQGRMDALVFQHGNFGFAIGDDRTGVLVGEPIGSQFETKVMVLGKGWFEDMNGCKVQAGDTAFALSNSSIFVFGSRRYVLGVGGKAGASVLISPLMFNTSGSDPCRRVAVPIAGGVYSVYFRDLQHGVVVGGDAKKPEDGGAAFTSDMGLHWTAAATPPHGFRSAVAWSDGLKAWVAVGPTGSDVSRDDGKTWSRLDDGAWNALSLPFVVGPQGRIGRLAVK